MSLATRCTHCGTIFKVVQDQLKVSEGWVRCGRCNEVFHALPTLFDLDTEPPPPRSGLTPPSSPAPAPTAVSGPAAEDLPAFLTRRSVDAPPPEPDAEPAVAPSSRPAFAPTFPATFAPTQPHDPADLPGEPAPFVPPPTAPAVTRLPDADDLLDPPLPAWARHSALRDALSTDPLPTAPATDFELDTEVGLEPDAGDNAQAIEPESTRPEPGTAPAIDLDLLPEPAPPWARADQADHLQVDFDPPRTDEADALDSRYLMPSSRSERKLPRRRATGPEFADAEFPNDAMLDLDADWAPSEPAADLQAEPAAPVTARLPETAASPLATASALADSGATLAASSAGDSDFVPEQPVPPPSQRRTRPSFRRRDPAGVTPEFMKRAERQAIWRHPATRAALGVVATALGATLALQLTHQFRDVIAAHHPATRPYLEDWCAMAGCRLAPPLRLDDLQVESATLVRATSEGAQRYRLAVVVHNRSPIGLAWPHVDLTLTDSNGAVVARRAFAPDEARWLDTAEPRTDSPKRPQGLGALPPAAPPGRSTTLWWDVKVTALSPAGYTAELFYP